MTDPRITKTITVVWDGVDWRDKTGVKIIGVVPPVHNMQDIAEQGEAHHPFDKSYTVTYEQVRKMINDAFEQRVTPQYPHYFVEHEWLVKMGTMIEYVNRIVAESEIRLRREIVKPWYKRW